MRHPPEGTLRRLVDEPAGVADPDHHHVARCRRCRAGLDAARSDAAVAGAALAAGLSAEREVDVDAGWDRLARSAPAGPRPRRRSPAGARHRRVGRGPAVAAGAVALLLTGASAAAAAGWLPIFRTEQVAPVAVTAADLAALPDLSAYGEVRVTGRPDLRPVADADAAREATGLAVPRVTALPRGVTGSPRYQVGDPVSAEFRFSADRAARAAAAAGGSLPPPPPGLDGSEFRLVAGPGVAAVWSEARGVPALLVARAGAPTAYSSSGVPFPVARDYLLSLPGLPEPVAAQLRRFPGDGTTLPLPVPADQVTTSAADVNGVPATVLTSRDGLLAGVVWVDDGTVNVVAGSLDADEVLAVARGLRSP